MESIWTKPSQVPLTQFFYQVEWGTSDKAMHNIREVEA